MTVEKKKRAKRVKRPKHPGEIRAWRFALRLDQDVSALHRALDIAWGLRNDLALARAQNGQAVRLAKQEGRTPPPRLTKRDQEMVLAERRKREPKGAGRLHSLVVKNIADRIDEGWKRFWEARAEGRQAIAPPKRVKRERYRSLCYPQYGNGVRIRDGRVELAMIGSFRLHDHRKIRGRIQTVTLKWMHGRWWCVVTSQIQASEVFRPAAPGAGNTGADPGLTAVLTFSDGRRLDPPRALAENLAKLRHEQRKLSRKFEALKAQQAAERRLAQAEGRDAEALPRSGRLKRQIARVGRVHTKVTNIRDHWHKLNARRTAYRYDMVGYEKHSLAFMLRNRRLSRAASDRALSAQEHALASALGPRLVLVSNQRAGIGGNSQTCICGASVPKTLKDRWHQCPACGLNAPRDVVSANIVELIAFQTTTLKTAPGRGPKDAEGAMASACESMPAAEQNSARAPVETSTSRDPRVRKNTAGGHGLRRQARPVVIGQKPLARAPKPSDKTPGKRPDLSG